MAYDRARDRVAEVNADFQENLSGVRVAQDYSRQERNESRFAGLADGYRQARVDGAGKSTVLKLVARFYDVTGGAMLADGIDVRQLDLSAYRQQLGVVRQEPFLFAGTIRNNIAYGRLGGTR